MDCLLLFCLQNLYFEGAVGVMNHVPPVPPRIIELMGPDAHYRYDFNQTANPRARFAIGHEWDTTRVRTSLEIRHESWLGTKADKGEQSIWVSVRVLPFRWEPQ